MLQATRRWFRRNRTGLAIAAGAIGVGYLAGQYAIGKWLEARQRMAEEKVSEENIRRRFTQNQQDCSFTVLALLPTVREEIIGAFPVEDISDELQKQRAERLARTSAGGVSDATSTDIPSGAPSVTEDDRASLASMSLSGGSYLHASQMADSTIPAASRPRKTKVQLWYDMKIGSITRSLSLIYTLSLLTLLTRIQLNLLGRRAYLSSVVTLASSTQADMRASTISIENNDDDGHDNAYGSDFETNRKYLTFSWWLLHRGCRQITDRVRTQVEHVFGSVSPRQDMTLESLSALILEVRKRVEGSTVQERQRQDWLSLLLPAPENELAVLRESGMSTSPDHATSSDDPNSSMLHVHQPTPVHEQTIDSSLRRLLDETSDLIESPTFSHVLTLLLNAGFSHLVDNKLANQVFGGTVPPIARSSSLTVSRVTEIPEAAANCKLANTLAVFCKQAHAIAAGNGELPDVLTGTTSVQNEYLQAMDNIPELEAFAAVIYSSNFEYEAAAQQAGRDEKRADSADPSGGSDIRQQGLDPKSSATVSLGHDVTASMQDGMGRGNRGLDDSLQKVWEEALLREDGVKT